MNGLNEYQYPDLIRKHLLGGKVSPGRCTVSNFKDAEDWHIQQGTGTSGANSTLWGKPIVQFDILYELSDNSDAEGGPSDLEYWDNTFEPTIQATTSGAKPQAATFFHPDLIKVTEVCKASIGNKVRDPKGMTNVTVTYICHRPPKPKTVSKATAKPGGGSTGVATKPDPNADAKRRLAALVDEAKQP